MTRSNTTPTGQGKVRAETIEALTMLVNKALMRTFPDDPAELAVMFDAATELARRSADLRDELMRHLADAMPSKLYAIPGVGSWERKKSQDRREWQHREIGASLIPVAKRERMDALTAEITMGEAEAMMVTLLACAGISYWKTGELRGRGIDPDDFCTVTPGRTTVRKLS